MVWKQIFGFLALSAFIGAAVGVAAAAAMIRRSLFSSRAELAQALGMFVK
jgi:hypothetical protein